MCWDECTECILCPTLVAFSPTLPLTEKLANLQNVHVPRTNLSKLNIYRVAKSGTEELGVYFPSWAPKPTSLMVALWLPNFCTIFEWEGPDNITPVVGNDDLPCWLDGLRFGSVVQTFITKTKVRLCRINNCIPKWKTYWAFRAVYLFLHIFRRHPL